MNDLAAAARATIAAGTARYRCRRVTVPASARTLHGVHAGVVDFAQERVDDTHAASAEAVRLLEK